MGSGLLLFVVSGTIPFLLLLITRLRARAAGTAVLVHYVLTAVIGAALAYGAYTMSLS